ncbi:hypothetical protein CQ048_22165 [Pseudomonas trivialis]|nr:hypothetical protein CQ048_22165 [Pseudomonas trivialis]PRB22502.1 hypothetical protein CQ041_22125 [Pseudomonas sp. MYb60]
MWTHSWQRVSRLYRNVNGATNPPVVADFRARAVHPSAHPVADPPPSQASQLPHWMVGGFKIVEHAGLAMLAEQGI